MGMTFRPVTPDERARLLASLRANAEGGAALLQSPGDTSFAGHTLTPEEEETEAMIHAIRSLPCHY